MLARRWLTAMSLVSHSRRPFRWFVMVATVAGVVSATGPADVPDAWWDGLRLALRIAVIGFGAWLLASVLLFVEDLGLSRYRTDVSDNRAARRVRTQVLLVRRLTVAVVVVLALGMALLSLPGVEAVGASVLASAGVISVIAAVAAQPTLGNLVAGLQIAFSDALRLDDVVVVEGEWGRIEEITLSYVVVRIWDDRRLVLPTTYFTRTPFENWTRSSSALLGGVELDVDWRTDLAAMREELDRVLAGTDLWDERTKVLQVTEATGGLVRVAGPGQRAGRRRPVGPALPRPRADGDAGCASRMRKACRDSASSSSRPAGRAPTAPGAPRTRASDSSPATSRASGAEPSSASGPTRGRRKTR